MNNLEKHYEPNNFSDKVALGFTKFLRFLADTFFKKRYLNLSEDIRNAINSYVKDVKEEKFPEEEHTFSMEKEELEKLEKEIG